MPIQFEDVTMVVKTAIILENGIRLQWSEFNNGEQRLVE